MPHLSERFNPCTDTDTDMTKADRIDKLEAIREEQNAKIGELQDEVERLREALYKCWKILEQTHHDPQHRLAKIRREIPEELSQYNALDAAEDAHE